MYSIPKDFALDVFNGAVVQQVCYTANTISLMFGIDMYIDFEGEFHFSRNGEQGSTETVFPVHGDAGILKLLERQIVKILCDDSNNLIINFDNGSRLTLLSSDNFESYSIKAKGQLVRV